MRFASSMPVTLSRIPLDGTGIIITPEAADLRCQSEMLSPMAWRRINSSRAIGSEWRGEMNELTQKGWARLDPDRFRLTPEGLRFADSAAELFLR